MEVVVVGEDSVAIGTGRASFGQTWKVGRRIFVTEDKCDGCYESFGTNKGN